MLESTIEKRVAAYANKLEIMNRKYSSPNHRSVPDRIFLPANGCAFFIEFKREIGGRLTPGQIREIDKLLDRHYPVYVVNSVKEGKELLDSIHALL